MIVLGIDPGSRHTGFGVVRRRGARIEAIAHGRITLPAQLELSLRLRHLVDGLEELIATHRPDVVSIETLFGGKNIRSLIVLAQARGAILAILGGHGLAPTEYTPAEVKSALTGNGRADKTQVARMVEVVLRLDAPPESADAADALAVAICYAQRFTLDQIQGRGKKASIVGRGR